MFFLKILLLIVLLIVGPGFLAVSLLNTAHARATLSWPAAEARVAASTPIAPPRSKYPSASRSTLTPSGGSSPSTP